MTGLAHVLADGRAVGNCHSVFHQLIVIAAQRDPQTRLYALPKGEDPFQWASELRAQHNHVFRKWLSLETAEQDADFSSFLIRTRAENRRIVVDVLRAAYGWETLVPDGAAVEDRNLFKTSLRRLLDTIGRRVTVDCPV